MARRQRRIAIAADRQPHVDVAVRHRDFRANGRLGRKVAAGRFLHQRPHRGTRCRGAVGYVGPFLVVDRLLTHRDLLLATRRRRLLVAALGARRRRTLFSGRRRGGARHGRALAYRRLVTCRPLVDFVAAGEQALGKLVAAFGRNAVADRSGIVRLRRRDTLFLGGGRLFLRRRSLVDGLLRFGDGDRRFIAAQPERRHHSSAARPERICSAGQHEKRHHGRDGHDRNAPRRTVRDRSTIIGNQIAVIAGVGIGRLVDRDVLARRGPFALGTERRPLGQRRLRDRQDIGEHRILGGVFVGSRLHFGLSGRSRRRLFELREHAVEILVAPRRRFDHLLDRRVFRLDRQDGILEQFALLLGDGVRRRRRDRRELRFDRRARLRIDLLAHLWRVLTEIADCLFQYRYEICHSSKTCIAWTGRPSPQPRRGDDRA